VEMASGFNRKVGWPGNQMTGAPLNWHCAVWADPTLGTILGPTVGWLHKARHPVLNLGALHSHAN